MTEGDADAVPRPLPTRREFLARTLGTALAAPIALREIRIPGRSPRDEKKRTTLVVVELAGGNDGLSTIVPYADPAYARARKRTRIAADLVLKIDGDEGFHPALGGVKRLFDAGQATIVRSVSYPSPSRSHFLSMDIWQTATLSPKSGTSGWIGRFADTSPDDAAFSSTRIISIGDMTPRSLAGDRSRPTAFANPLAYRYVAKPEDTARFDALTHADDAAGSNVEFIRRVADRAVRSSEGVRRAIARYRTKTVFPDTRIASDLSYASALIAADTGARVIWVTLGGFDTHVDQKPRHDRLMGELDGAIAAFHEDLDRNGGAARTITMVFSEFGRRVAENASAGTDHGKAAPVFLFGAPLRGGFIGERPSLTDLADGDLRGKCDFRSIYAAILDRFLGVPASGILGEAFAPLDLFRA